jgi:hypothetical protein
MIAFAWRASISFARFPVAMRILNRTLIPVARGQAAEQRLADTAAGYAQARADAAREREELRVALEDRARVLEESRAELRERAERAERDLTAARAELGQLRSADDAGPDAPGRARHGRASQQPGDQAE